MVFDGFVAGRDLVWDYLASHKIYSRKYFYPLTNEFQCYQGRFSGEQTPVAKYVADRVLTLPDVCRSGHGGCGPDLRAVEGN